MGSSKVSTKAIQDGIIWALGEAGLNRWQFRTKCLEMGYSYPPDLTRMLSKDEIRWPLETLLLLAEIFRKMGVRKGRKPLPLDFFVCLATSEFQGLKPETINLYDRLNEPVVRDFAMAQVKRLVGGLALCDRAALAAWMVNQLSSEVGSNG